MIETVKAPRRWDTRTAKSCGVVLALVLAAVFAGSAHAYYAHEARGSGSASVARLDAPTGVEASAGAGTVTLSWHPVRPPASEAVSYYVSRDGLPIGGPCGDPASPIGGTSCTDGGLGTGSYTYTVTAVWRSWTAASTPRPVSLSSGAAAQIVLSGSTTNLISGSTRELIATVEDSAGNTVGSGPDSDIEIDFQQQGGSGSVAGTASATASEGVATTTVTGVLRGVVDMVATGRLRGRGATTSDTLSFAVVLGSTDATQSTLMPTSSSITADGTSTQVLTVQTKDANGNDETTGGATVTITSQSGTGTIGPVTDNENGTYTATVTAPTAAGSGTFVATVNGDPVESGNATQTEATVDYAPGPAVGIVLSDETVVPTPDAACSVSAGSTICSSYDEPNTSGNALRARLTLVDQAGNPVVNDGPSIGIDLGASGDGSLDLSGPDALTIPTGASTTDSTFTATRHNGNKKTLTVTATVHGTSQTLTLVLSSAVPPATDRTPPGPAAGVTSRGAASEGLSTTREIVFFAVLSASVTGLVALLTMPIPRRRRASRRRAS